jgi:hypothetical protein
MWLLLCRLAHEAAARQSLTLSLPTRSAAEAAELVSGLRKHFIIADSRCKFSKVLYILSFILSMHYGTDF